MADSKQLVPELYKQDKLNGDNYDVWHRKVMLILEDKLVLEAITQVLESPPNKNNANSAQCHRDLEAYNAWKAKNSTARITILSTMNDALLCEYEQVKTAYALWNTLKAKYGGTSVSKLRRLTIKFDTYKKRPNTIMRQHLLEMSKIIQDLNTAGHVLSNEQKAQAVIRLLLSSWEHMKVNMTHNESIITFDDISRHLELEMSALRQLDPLMKLSDKC